MLRYGVIQRTSLAGGRLWLAFAACLLACVLSSPARAETPPTRIAYLTGSANDPVTQVWLANASGGEKKLLGPGEDPLLAPDGQSVAVALASVSANPEKGPGIGIYSALGTPVADYLDLENATYTPLAWSPDSRYLAVARQSTVIPFLASGSGLLVIDTQTGTVTSIAEGVINGASFAQDGSDRVVFAYSHSLSVSAPTNVFISAPHGGGLTRLTHDGHSLNPLWGPRFIAYDRERLRRNDAPVFQIWLQAPTSTQARRLTNLKVGPLVSGLDPLAFSASGSRLLAEFGGEDTSEAWVVSVPSGHARRVLVRGRSVEAGGISRDGSTVLVDEDGLEGPPSGGRVALVPFAGGRAKVLLTHGAQASWNG